MVTSATLALNETRPQPPLGKKQQADAVRSYTTAIQPKLLTIHTRSEEFGHTWTDCLPIGGLAMVTHST